MRREREREKREIKEREKRERRERNEKSKQYNLSPSCRPGSFYREILKSPWPSRDGSVESGRTSEGISTFSHRSDVVDCYVRRAGTLEPREGNGSSFDGSPTVDVLKV